MNGRRSIGTQVRIFSACAGLWLLRYVLQVGLPIGHTPRWYAYFDQSRYLLSATAFAHGDLAAGKHWYPLLYPLVASPFARLTPADPFLLPDCILFGLTAVAFGLVLQHLGMKPIWSVLIFLAANLIAWPLAKLWVEPWTTSLSSALLWWLLALLTDLTAPTDERTTGKLEGASWTAVGALAGALPLARPTDLLISLISLSFAGWHLWQGRSPVMRHAAHLIIGASAIVVPYVALHLTIYGLRETDYEHMSAIQGFNFADLPWKLAVVVVSPKPWYPDGRSLLEGLPLLLPGLAGLIALVPKLPAPGRRLLALIGLIAVPYCLVFLAYTDLQPPGIWFFGNAHYFKWLFPLLIAGCWFLLEALRNRAQRSLALLALGCLLGATCIRPRPVPLGDDASARMLLFAADTAGMWRHGERTKVWDRGYFAPASVVDAKGILLNVANYHQVPDQAGERAIAISRLFASSAHRIDPTDASTKGRPQAPYARYAVGLSLDWPCWIVEGSCYR